MSLIHAFVATTRFGLGPRPGDLESVARDPRGWLLGQLGTAAPIPALAGLAPGHVALANLLTARRQNDEAAERQVREESRQIYVAEATARTRAALAATQPFRERLVQFWSNHFTVSIQRPVLLGIAGSFEREAIRPHVTGRFADLLRAVMMHPAMLLYLDNAQSFGPNSIGGQLQGRGLNENLAREILELHTLGVDGGYGQTDVREFAKILTGWSVGQPQRSNMPGSFEFVLRIHEPGTKTFLGQDFLENGMAEGEAALAMLSRHPATQRHVATKLARHFVADDPPEAVVGRLVRVFRDTDGDLAALARALIDTPEVWAQPLAKVKTPQDFVVSAMRALGSDGAELPPERMLRTLGMLGQAPFAAPTPQGWPDTAGAWIAPEAVLRRIELAQAIAQRAASFTADPVVLARGVIGPAAAPDTMRAIERAESRTESLALLLAAPEFQRR
jgi:uncharacterized protein (DUF1800 family)